MIASAEITKNPEIFSYKGCKIKIVYGDFKEELKGAADHLEKAIEFAANDNQKEMMREYVKSFRTGSIEAHKRSQIAWIKDIG